MRIHRTNLLTARPSLPLLLTIGFLATLWVAGGASREDAFGQVIVRTVSAFILIALALAAPRPTLGSARPVLLLLVACITLAALQLVPLPPPLWQLLPGREPFIEAAAAANLAQPWRPWAIVPGGAFNALTSLIVPATAFALFVTLPAPDRQWLPGLILGSIVAAMLVGLLQLSGGSLDNPLINDTPGQISGSFANRNHLALFLAFGCLLTPVWAFLGGRRPGWRAPVALGLIVLFPLTILATGSRAGVLVGMLGLGFGSALSFRDIRRTLRRYPRWTLPALLGGLATIVAGLILFTIASGRALSIDRAMVSDPSQDMRARALPVVIDMMREYFPAGSGTGSFDPLFRLHEPFALLKLTYFNHAHNDWLEIVLDTGIAGLMLLLCAVVWWGWRSFVVLREGGPGVGRPVLPRAGSALLLLVFVASIFDYPARTPMIMAIIVFAGLWLSGLGETKDASALP